MSSIGFIPTQPPRRPGIQSAWQLLYDYTLKPVDIGESFIEYLWVIGDNGKSYLVEASIGSPYVLLTEDGAVELREVPTNYQFEDLPFYLLLSPFVVTARSDVVLYLTPSIAVVRDDSGNRYAYDLLSDRIMYQLDIPSSLAFSPVRGFVWEDGDDISRFGGKQFLSWREDSTVKTIIFDYEGATVISCSSSDFTNMWPQQLAVHNGEYRLSIGSTFYAREIFEYACKPDGSATKLHPLDGRPSCFRSGRFMDKSSCGVFVDSDKEFVVYRPFGRCLAAYMIPYTEPIRLEISNRYPLPPLLVEYCGEQVLVSPVTKYLHKSWAAFLYSSGGKYYLSLLIVDPDRLTDPYALVNVKVYEFDPSRVGD